MAELRALPGATVTEIDEEQGYVAAAVPYARELSATWGTA